MPGPKNAFHCQGPTCNLCCKINNPDVNVKYLRVTPEEIAAMAAHLGVSESSFRQTVVHPDGDSILVDPVTGVCKLWAQGQGCTVHPAKPSVCAKFPADPSVAGSKKQAMQAAEICPNFKFPYHWYPRR